MFRIICAGVGNISSSAEYNFFADPESAYIALETLNCPITIVPWETCIAENISISMVRRGALYTRSVGERIKIFEFSAGVAFRDSEKCHMQMGGANQFGRIDLLPGLHRMDPN